jgi:hypothetical protein
MAILRPAVRQLRLWAALLLALSGLAATGPGPIPDFKIKAVFLVKFIDFVDWPDGAFAKDNPSLAIGILGTDPFGNVLDDAVRGELIKNRHIVIRRFHNAREVKGVQVLFIDNSEEWHARAVLSALEGQPILTVSDMERFCYEGGIVRFVTENNRVHFRINVDAAKRANIQISSQLLSLAEIVHD